MSNLTINSLADLPAKDTPALPDEPYFDYSLEKWVVGGSCYIDETAAFRTYSERLRRFATQSAESRARRAEEDAERLDYLESERLDVPGTLFRRNEPITRAAIDAARGKASHD